MVNGEGDSEGMASLKRMCGDSAPEGRTLVEATTGWKHRTPRATWLALTFCHQLGTCK